MRNGTRKFQLQVHARSQKTIEYVVTQYAAGANEYSRLKIKLLLSVKTPSMSRNSLLNKCRLYRGEKESVSAFWRLFQTNEFDTPVTRWLKQQNRSFKAAFSGATFQQVCYNLCANINTHIRTQVHLFIIIIIKYYFQFIFIID